MRRLVIVTAAALALTTTNASAGPATAALVTGDAIYEDCKAVLNGSQYDKQVAACLGYAAGVTDMVLEMQEKSNLNLWGICIPKLNLHAIAYAFARYLDLHPEARKQKAALAVIDSLRAVYACGNQK